MDTANTTGLGQLLMSNVPDGRRAADVAEIRDWLVEHLQGDIGSALEHWGSVSLSSGYPAPTSVPVELSGLAEAKLFWVPPEETDVISDAATDLPDDLVLTEDFIPSISGFVIFGGNWYGIDAQVGEKSIWPIRGFRWGPVTLPDKCGPDGFGVEGATMRPGIAISAYSYSLDMRGSALSNFTIQSIRDHIAALEGNPVEVDWSDEDFLTESDPAWMPLGRSDWIIGEHWRHHPVYSPDSVSYASVIEDRCLLAALWGLMATCPPVEYTPNRAARRRAERQNRTAPPVRIVTWRGPQGQRPVTAAEAEATRHLTKRQYIEKFWRNQPYGPQNSLRRWQLIPGYWRGPEDGPLADPHTTIHKVVGGKR